jgi:SH3-like domain-containing protein
VQAGAVQAGAAQPDAVQPDAMKSGDVLPYFASLKQATTNVRIGPGFKYPVRWVYKRASLPVEVLYRYGNWRRIRDNSGDGGWVHAIMLSRHRTACIQARNGTDALMRSSPDSGAPVVAILKPDVIVAPSSCGNSWCKVRVIGRGLGGYVLQSRLWGVYPDEVF